MSNTDLVFLVLIILGMINFFAADTMLRLICWCVSKLFSVSQYDHTKHDLLVWGVIVVVTAAEVHYLSLGS
jgi:hypothetical protein